MGKLILCSGARTSRPYVITQLGVRIYSMEELCYYLYHYVYMIEDELFCDDLFDFIEQELKLPERADKLRLLKKKNSDMKTMVTVILCSTDYYTENEIKNLLKLLDTIIDMPRIKRNCIKAGNYLSDHQYSHAAAEYEQIINAKDAAELTPEEYGDLYHNLAVAKVHITGLKEALGLFWQAYERNHREESLVQYLYALKLSHNENEYRKKTEEYQLEEEAENQMSQFYHQIDIEAMSSEKSQHIGQLHEIRSEGKMTEFYQKAENIIRLWKEQVRQN